ncbi:hypothetical protein [Enterobacter sp. Tr-810]|nr:MULTISPECIES: hypothetical protein [Enterobacter]
MLVVSFVAVASQDAVADAVTSAIAFAAANTEAREATSNNFFIFFS